MVDPCELIETLAGVIGVTDMDDALLLTVRASYAFDEDTGELAYDASTRHLEDQVSSALPNGWSIEKHRSREDARPQTEVWHCRAR